jgi:hypothetical protein
MTSDAQGERLVHAAVAVRELDVEVVNGGLERHATVRFVRAKRQDDRTRIVQNGEKPPAHGVADKDLQWRSSCLE